MRSGWATATRSPASFHSTSTAGTRCRPARNWWSGRTNAGRMVHLHNSEVAVDYLLAESETGADIINCGPAANIADVRNAFAGKTCFSGNLDPIEVLMRATPAAVAADAERIVEIGDASGGYVFCTGEMNPRDTPEENMRAMIETARKAAPGADDRGPPASSARPLTAARMGQFHGQVSRST